MQSNIIENGSSPSDYSRLIFKSRKEFIKELKHSENLNTRDLYLEILKQLKFAIQSGDFDNFSKFGSHLEIVAGSLDALVIEEYSNVASNPFVRTNFIILACQSDKIKILKHLFNDDAKNLLKLSSFVGKTSSNPRPDEVDEFGHNAFYYAIRSDGIDLLDFLITKWPGNYFSDNSYQLDRILCQAYEELNWKNVALSDEMRVYVENQLVNLRFFADETQQSRMGRVSRCDIDERFRLILENVQLLDAEYAGVENIDGRFLYIAKFITKNIHIVKRQVKSSYDRLPWEEIEFCLTCFIFAHSKSDEINIFFHATLNRAKILSHLRNFGRKLEEESQRILSSNFSEIPRASREKIIEQIIENNPQFRSLYDDYEEIRDIYSFKKISECLDLALSLDPKDREAQLIITRSLQIIGENMKNTLESPKLSNATNELLLMTLPNNTRDIVIDLRNTLSHGYSLSKRREIEENTDENFFVGIQNDTKQIRDVITKILFEKKVKTIKTLLKKLTDCETVKEVAQIAKMFCNVELDTTLWTNYAKALLGENSQEATPKSKLSKLIEQLKATIPEKSAYEETIFEKLNELVNSEENRLENLQVGYTEAFHILRTITEYISDEKPDTMTLREMQSLASKALENLTSRANVSTLDQIVELCSEIYKRILPKLEDSYELHRLIIDLHLLADSTTTDQHSIEQLRNQLLRNTNSIPAFRKTQTYTMDTEDCQRQLIEKLTGLKNKLRNSKLRQHFLMNFHTYKSNKKLQITIEMLVLDIMSILDLLGNYLENNHLFLDDATPILTGKGLRNHLAHDNALIDILLPDPSISVAINARKLITEDIVNSKKKIGLVVQDDICVLKRKFCLGLTTIAQQERLFIALENGNVVDARCCLENGADIHGRNMSSWSSLHFAAKSGNIEVVKYVYGLSSKADIKNAIGQNPLHIAAIYGRSTIIEFLIKQADVNVNQVDRNGRTALHLTAKYGHMETVKALLKNGADRMIQCKSKQLPIHLAVENQHRKVVEILLDPKIKVDSYQTACGFTLLQIACHHSNLDIVNLLISKGADINYRNDRKGTALHPAVLQGHYEIVMALIAKGIDVNARVIDGCNPLQYAVRFGHDRIALALIENGANVNASDMCTRESPLHFACINGQTEIVKVLLRKGAHSYVSNINGTTPLQFAAENGHAEIVRILIKQGVEIEAKNRRASTALHLAAKNGHKEVVEILLRHRAKMMAKDVQGETPLHIAARYSQRAVCETLIQNGADTNAEQHSLGNRPLHCAASTSNKDIIELLINNGAQVNAKNLDGYTALHVAAQEGQLENIMILLDNGADVNVENKAGYTALFSAVIGGKKNVVEFLLKNGCDVNATSFNGGTPLNIALEIGNREIVDILLKFGANVHPNAQNHTSPLLSAIKSRRKELIELIIHKGADVNGNMGEPLQTAVFMGYKDVVDLLLRCKARTIDGSLLETAIKQGYSEIVRSLIQSGMSVNGIGNQEFRPLHLAALKKRKDIVKILIENGASINSSSSIGTPLHVALNICENEEVVQVLLNSGADINTRDPMGRVPIEIAVAYNYQDCVKYILSKNTEAIQTVAKDSFSLLHIAAQGGHVEMADYLIRQGCDVYASNDVGTKSIHLAAREGRTNIVRYFIEERGVSVQEPGTYYQSPLHYAVITDSIETVNYLLSQGANVNANDLNGATPMHIAVALGSEQSANALLANGAIYNHTDNLGYTPSTTTNGGPIIAILEATADLFQAIASNNPSKVENSIRRNAAVNAKNSKHVTPLHLAACKGRVKIVEILLENKANPNVTVKGDCAPLHYAAKFSHMSVVKMLLSYGAIYNKMATNKKAPLDFATNPDIIGFLKLIGEAFKNVEHGNVKVIDDLRKIKDFGAIKAIMSACNQDNRTIILAAIHSKFPAVDKLKELFQEDISLNMAIVELLCAQEQFAEALIILERALSKRLRILGPNNPATLDIQKHMGKLLYKQKNYPRALGIFEEIFEKQTKALGANHQEALYTKSSIALVLHRQGKNDEALKLFEEVCEKQERMLGAYHADCLESKIHLAMVLDKIERYDEALKIYKDALEHHNKKADKNRALILVLRNNIAMVLCNQGKHDEAATMYRKVYEDRKRALGPGHSDTLRSLHNMINALSQKGNHDETLRAYNDLLELQKRHLGPDHFDTIHTRFNIAIIYFRQGKMMTALEIFKKDFEKRKAFLGANHPDILQTQRIVNIINHGMKFEGHDHDASMVSDLKERFYAAICNNSESDVQYCLNSGINVNDSDCEGRTPLHFAVNNGHLKIVRILLDSGADPTRTTKKGNTPLHTAVTKGLKRISEVLLDHVDSSKCRDFVNTQTSRTGTTALHIAAKSGSIELVKLLLRFGAVYEIENFELKTPLHVSRDPEVTRLLEMVDEIFLDVLNGNDIAAMKLSNLKTTKFDEFQAVASARQNGEMTLLQTAIASRNEELSAKLIEILKN